MAAGRGSQEGEATQESIIKLNTMGSFSELLSALSRPSEPNSWYLLTDIVGTCYGVTQLKVSAFLSAIDINTVNATFLKLGPSAFYLHKADPDTTMWNQWVEADQALLREALSASRSLKIPPVLEPIALPCSLKELSLKLKSGEVQLSSSEPNPFQHYVLADGKRISADVIMHFQQQKPYTIKYYEILLLLRHSDFSLHALLNETFSAGETSNFEMTLELQLKKPATSLSHRFEIAVSRESLFDPMSADSDLTVSVFLSMKGRPTDSRPLRCSAMALLHFLPPCDQVSILSKLEGASLSLYQQCRSQVLLTLSRRLSQSIATRVESASQVVELEEELMRLSNELLAYHHERALLLEAKGAEAEFTVKLKKGAKQKAGASSGRIRGLQTDIHSREQEILKLKKQLQEKEQSNASLSKDNRALKSENQRLQRELEELKRRLQEVTPQQIEPFSFFSSPFSLPGFRDRLPDPSVSPK